MVYFLLMRPILLKCQYLMKCWVEYSHVNQNDLQMELNEIMLLFSKLLPPPLLIIPKI